LEGTKEEEKLCQWIDCDGPYDDGVTLKPVVGIAIFWRNLGDDGKGM
jgi:prolyl 4-hydroxylase